MSEQDLEDFSHSLDELFRIFSNLPSSKYFIEAGKAAEFDDMEEKQ